MNNENNLEPVLESILDNQDSHLENLNKNVEHLLMQTADNNNEKVLEASLEVQGDIKDSIKELSTKLDPKEISDGATFIVKGVKGEPFKYEDFTEEQLNKLKPIKGKDYWTDKELNTIIKSIEDNIRIPEDGKTPTQEELISLILPLIPEPLNGEDGKDGEDGEDGKDAIVDYDFIVKEVIRKIPKAKDGKDFPKEKLEEIEKKLAKLIKDNKSVFIGGQTMPEAPTDNKLYGRKNGDWTEVVGGGSGGQVDSVVAGIGISVDDTDPANPIVTNSAPDQVVSITAGTNIDSVTGTYPNFTINATTQGGSYLLPTASDTVLGGVKVGDRLSIDVNGVLSADIQGGGGAVDSVNSQTGNVVLDADDIDDTSTTNKFVTATDITNLSNLSGINTGDQDLSVLALKTNVLELDNTTAFTPDADYEPATKKYVDDKIIAGDGISVAEGTGANENKLVITNTDKGSDIDLSGYALTGDIPTDISELTDTTGIIPEDTGDLTNGAGFITSGDIPAAPTRDSLGLDTDDTVTFANLSGTNTGDQDATDFDIKDLTDSTSLRSTWSGKQDALGFTPENVVNKRTSFQATPTDTAYPSEKLVKDSLDGKISASSTDTLTNKTINANGTGNSISNLEVADFASGVIDTDLSSVSASDDTIPSAKAVKEALNTKANLSGQTFTGAIVPADHGTATNPEVVAVVYGTGSAPTASTTPIGTLFVKYTA